MGTLASDFRSDTVVNQVDLLFSTKLQSFKNAEKNILVNSPIKYMLNRQSNLSGCWLKALHNYPAISSTN